MEFIEALAECACVDEACKRVGMSATSAYALRRRLDAAGFRQAWDHALDHGIRRLSDAAFSRALNRVAQPAFCKGEQVGERRRYNDRLLMFLLSHADPLRFGRLAGLQMHDIADPRRDAQFDLARHIHRLRDEDETEPLVPGSAD